MGNREKGKIKLAKQEFTGKAKKKERTKKTVTIRVFIHIWV